MDRLFRTAFVLIGIVGLLAFGLAAACGQLTDEGFGDESSAPLIAR